MATGEPLIVAVVLNWNGWPDTIDCLRSLVEQTYPNLHLIVVDNGSQDDSVARLRAAFPELELIESERNLGFAGGMNLGLRRALALGGAQVLVLNNDTIVAAEAVARLQQHVAGGVGLLAPIIYYASDPERVWSLGAPLNRWNLEASSLARDQLDRGQWPETIACDFVPGSAMLLSRQVLEEVGLFDESFFMYYEDLDLCLRIRQAGYQILSVTNARVWHKVSGSSGGRDSANERYWMARSSVHYFHKHAQAVQWPAVFFWRAGSALRTTWRLAGKGQAPAARAYWRGLWHGVRAWRA